MKLIQFVKRRKKMLLFLLGILLLPILLFVINGTILANGETPIAGVTSHPATTETNPSQIKIMAYNIAKCFSHQGGMSFDEESKVRERLKKMADLINRENPDILFLSETIFESTPCEVNQVTELASMTTMHSWVFGENYNFGLPFYRVVGGNAILSRFPLEALANPSLAGRKPFWKTHNNRRVLWAAVTLGSERILLASLHTDSFNLPNNAKQMQQILEYAGEQPAILAGDFNARPDTETLQLVKKSEKFTGAIEGDLTFPANKPDRRIDYIFAPKQWTLIDHRVLPDVISDHCAVVSTFTRKIDHE